MELAGVRAAPPLPPAAALPCNVGWPSRWLLPPAIAARGKPDGKLLTHMSFKYPEALIIINPRARAAREKIPHLSPVERVWHVPGCLPTPARDSDEEEEGS